MLRAFAWYFNLVSKPVRTEVIARKAFTMNCLVQGSNPALSPYSCIDASPAFYPKATQALGDNLVHLYICYRGSGSISLLLKKGCQAGGLNPQPFDPKASALTTRPPRHVARLLREVDDIVEFY